MSRKKDPAVAALDYFGTAPLDTAVTVHNLAKRTLAQRMAQPPVSTVIPLGQPTRPKQPRKVRAKKADKVAWPDDDARAEMVRKISADPLAGR
jgi:hypothetical protein